MSDIEHHRARIKAIMPAPDTDDRRDFLKAAMDVIADAILEHADGDPLCAATGLSVLASGGFTRMGVR